MLMFSKIAGIDPQETQCLTYMVRSGKTYIITTNKPRTKYFLYVLQGETAVKTSKQADTPTELERYINRIES